MEKDSASLSVLIPVYNWDCSDLLAALHEQGVSLGIPFEIVVADDCSPDRSHIGNLRGVAERLAGCRLIELGENLGRAAVRNMLAAESRFSKLLFLDCDSGMVSENFLKEFVSASEQASVVCGRIVHPDCLPERGVELRYSYEKRADAQRWASVRSKRPYDRFTPFSFLIDREVFESIRFDESFAGYGYEDVLFGMELKERGISVLHIDTPLMHLGLESNRVFLEKSRQAIENAWEHRKSVGEGSALLNCYSKLKKIHMSWPFRLVWKMWANCMEQNLCGSKPSLKIFSLYKLCYLCSLADK